MTIPDHAQLIEASRGTDAKSREFAIVKLGEIYRGDAGKSQALADLITEALPFLASPAVSKAKTTKVLTMLIDSFHAEGLALQTSVCKTAIAWAQEQHRIFLRQSLQTRLAGFLLAGRLYTEALALIEELLSELKRLDDKSVLMDVQLLESRVYHALRNFAKSRAALTGARTSANAIYCPPLQQAGLDMQSGILHAEERDYGTGYSYFFECLEGYTGQDDPRALFGLKYMMLCKIMKQSPEDVHALSGHKAALRYVGEKDVVAMRAVATSLSNRSLLEFESALKTYKQELTNDPIVRSHLADLYDTLLEKNLLRVIEPYSRVEIAHIAALVSLPTLQVEAKLSQMILDGVFTGILDQGNGCLKVFDAIAADKTYGDALETIKNMGNVVESLYAKACTLSH